MRRFNKLVRIITWTLHGITAVLMLGVAICMVLKCFYFSRSHFIWIWIPLTDWRFRVMVWSYGVELRTCFGRVQDHDAPQVYLAWLAFGVTFLNWLLEGFKFVVDEMSKPKPALTRDGIGEQSVKLDG